MRSAIVGESATLATCVGEARDGAAGRMHRRAVVDIGSNSVRIVVYDGPARSPYPICNEKALCGLGRDLGPDGALNESAVDDALRTLARFRELLRQYGDPPTMAVATAAVREARNGAEFVARADALGFRIEIIGGEREAELAALGVVSAEPDATGLVGDMGGGSLELIAVDSGAIREKVSLSIGPLRLIQRFGPKPADARAAVADAVKAVDWLKARDRDTLYAVGGAWRAVARIHMHRRNHPLSILHHYELGARDAIDTCELIAQQSRASLEEIPGIARKRIDTLPHAALALKTLIETAGIRRIMVSAGGVREGLLFEQLTPEERAADPLLAGAQFLARRLSPEPSMGKAIAAAVETLFAEDGRARLRRTASELVDVAAYFHPDLRGIQAFDIALRAPFGGISHAERVMLALALYVRHEGKASVGPSEPALALATDEERQWALRLGLAFRLFGAFAPKAPHALDGCRLRRDGSDIVFHAPSARRALYEDGVRRRHDALAAAFGGVAKTDFYD